jgi:hypothetical protein
MSHKVYPRMFTIDNCLCVRTYVQKLGRRAKYGEDALRKIENSFFFKWSCGSWTGCPDWAAPPVNGWSDKFPLRSLHSIHSSFFCDATLAAQKRRSRFWVKHKDVLLNYCSINCSTQKWSKMGKMKSHHLPFIILFIYWIFMTK